METTVETTCEITRRSKLLDVLKAYPFLEDQIIEIAPPFKNLRNLVLRKTVGQLATIEKVAQIGNLDVADLVSSLRRAAGQADLTEAPPSLQVPLASAGDPEWIRGEPAFVVNGMALLEEGQAPLAHVNELLGQMSEGQYLLLLTDFEPTPIVDAMRKQGHGVYHKVEDGGGRHLTYIRG